MNVANLFTRLRGMLHSANRSHVSPVVDGNAGPAYGHARVTPRPAPVDGPTVPLPPVNQRYVSRRYPDVQHINRSDVTCARRGSTRSAVGL